MKFFLTLSSVITPQKSFTILTILYNDSIYTVGLQLNRDVATIYNPFFLINE